jgi:hypothetical protein
LAISQKASPKRGGFFGALVQGGGLEAAKVYRLTRANLLTVFWVGLEK